MTFPRIGLVGCGNWGRFILRDLRNLGCSVSVVARSHSSIENALSLGAERIVAHCDDLPALDGIVVAVPTSRHADVVDSLCKRHVPIFCEKPLTNDPQRARQIVEQAGDRVFVMDKWRYHPGIEMLREIATSGELGDVTGLRLQHIGWGNPHADADVIWTLAPHCLSIVLEVLGAVPPPRQAMIEHLRGAAIGMVATLGTTPAVTIEVSARSPVKRREVQMHCSHGVAWLDEAYASNIRIARDDSTTMSIQERPISQEMPLLRELRAFVDHVLGGPPPRSTALEGAQIVQTIYELRQFARQAALARAA
jgi:predicted dehydrogenase